MTTATMLNIQEIGRWFGNRAGLRPLSITVREGDSIGVVGPNGSGKTTFLRLLAGHLPPTTGSIVYRGEPIPSEPYNRAFGFAGHELMLYEQLTAEENLRFFADLYDVSDYRERMMTLLERVNLFERKQSRIHQLSNGMRKKLSIARAVLHEPDLLLLDEPFLGIDASSTEEIVRLLESFCDRGGTLVLSSHNLKHVHRFCERVLLLDDGEMQGLRELVGGSYEDFERMYQSAVAQ